MKTIQFARLIIIALLINCQFISYSQQDYFKTEFDNGKVIINAVVPNANSVKILGQGGSYGFYNLYKDFTKIGDSLWQVTLDPAQINYITPGFHYYNFQVNGVLTLNPNEMAYTNYGNVVGVEIPDPDNDFYDIKDVPHGTIRMQLYYSSVTKAYRRCFIYLPPAYDTKSNEKYPVLFLQHGSSESEFSWHLQGKVSFILDNLISDGKALPMIVVMDNGMTLGDDDFQFGSLVVHDLIPLLQKNYLVKTDKLNMAAAGLSLGGWQVTDLSLNSSGRFGYVGIFSGGTDLNFTKTAGKQINDSIIVVYNGYGKNDENAVVQSFEDQLNKTRINHVTALFDGGHEWNVWRKCLLQFAQLVFKPYTYENPFIVNIATIENKLSVYPNPFKDLIHIQFDINSEFSDAGYELQDITGKKLLSYYGNKENAELKVSETLKNSSGKLYVLSVITNENIYQVKIIKQ